MKNFDTIIKFLSNLGLSFDQSKIYIALIEKGEMSVLEISRLTSLSRTNVYRHIEDLKTLGLVEEVLKDAKKVIMPVGVHKLELIVREQESKAEFLRKIMPELSSIISTTSSLSQPGTKVLLYRGVEGIKQMVWNTLKANKECVGYTFRMLSEIVGDKFDSEWRAEFAFRKLKFRDVISDSYLASLQESAKKDSYNKLLFQTRYLVPSILDVTHQMDIYNDVVAFYTWYDDEVFGVEIYNDKIAKLQKQLFELAWSSARELPLLSSNFTVKL